MTVPADLSNATLDELQALSNDVAAEVQRRTVERRVLDGLWGALMEAKNKGIPRGHMMKTVVKVVNEVYGQRPTADTTDEAQGNGK